MELCFTKIAEGHPKVNIRLQAQAAGVYGFLRLGKLLFKMLELLMICPVCEKEMVLKSADSSFNFDKKPKKKYDRKVYWCVKDDVWINLEIPSSKKKNDDN